ncbi:MAG: cation:proton antiporter [Mycobacteriales bacterium]
MLAAAKAAPALSPDQTLAFILADIAVILVVARVLGNLAKRVGQPVVVGEIIAGVLIGPTLLGPAIYSWTHPWHLLHCQAALGSTALPSITTCFFPPQSRVFLSAIGQLALVFYMFLVGLELDFDRLKGKGKGIASVSVGAVVVPVALAFAIGPLLYTKSFVPHFGTAGAGSKMAFTLFIAAMLAVTAFPVMARILQEKGLTSSPMGSVGIASAAVVTVLMFLALAVASGVATHQGSGKILAKFGYAALLIVVLFGLVRPALRPLGRSYESAGRLTPGTFGVLLIVLFASAFAAHVIGVNVIVGGFLAGAVMPARKSLLRDMSARMAEFTGVLLLPIFLAFSGLNTDFTKLSIAAVPGILIFIVAGILGKWLGAAVFARAAGLPWAEGNVLGVLMNCRGLLVLVVALSAFNSGFITAALQVGGVLMALVTTIMTAPLFDAFIGRVKAPPGELPESLLAPAAAGIYRVLAVADELDEAGSVCHAAMAAVGDRPRAEVDLCRPFAPPVTLETASGLGAQQQERDRSLRQLKVLSAFAGPGVNVEAFAFPSQDLAQDLLRIAHFGRFDAAVVRWRPVERTSAGHGKIVDQLVRGAPCPVIAYRPESDGAAVAEGPVVALFAGGPEGLAGQLAERVGALVGRPVQVLTQDGEQALVDAARSAAALVLTVEIPAPGQPLGEGRFDFALAVARCPIYLVREAAVPAAEGPVPAVAESG